MHLTHASLGWFGKNKRVDFRNLSSKSANWDFPFTLYVLARHYTTGGVRGRHFPLRWIWPINQKRNSVWNNGCFHRAKRHRHLVVVHSLAETKPAQVRVLGETNKKTSKYKYGAVRSREPFKTTQHVQRMRGFPLLERQLSQTSQNAEMRRCLPPLFFFTNLSKANDSFFRSHIMVSLYEVACFSEIRSARRLKKWVAACPAPTLSI